MLQRAISKNKPLNRGFMRRLQPIFRFIFLAIAILIFFGCSTKNNLPTSTKINLEESWEFVATVDECSCGKTGYKNRGIFTMIQNDSGFTGTFYNFYGLGGTLNGIISGEKVSFTIDQKQPCIGSFKGNGTINKSGTQIKGTYSGEDCKNAIKASFMAHIPSKKNHIE